MGFDFEEWDQLVKQKRADRINGQRADLERLQQAKVGAERLTGDPDWDIYLQQIQHAIEEFEAMAEMQRIQLTLPDLVDQNDIMRLKIGLSSTMGQLDALNFAMKLPKKIKEMGDKADEMLEALDAKSSEDQV